VKNNALQTLPVLHGIPLSRTLAYEPFADPEPLSTASLPKQRKTRKRTLKPERVERLISDIYAWRDNTLTSLGDQCHYLKAYHILSDNEKAALGRKLGRGTLEFAQTTASGKLVSYTGATVIGGTTQDGGTLRLSAMQHRQIFGFATLTLLASTRV
jgi:hypothetical protein